MTIGNEKQHARERALFHYTNALERGDFETITAILEQAQDDPILQDMIRELSEFYAAQLPHEQGHSRTNHRMKGNFMNMPFHTTITQPGRVRDISGNRPWVLSPTLAVAALLIIALGVLLFLNRDGPSASFLVAQDDQNTAEQNIEVARRAIALWDRAGEVTAEEVSEVYVPVALLHGHNPYGGLFALTAETMVNFSNVGLARWWPDLDVQIENIFAEGDLVIARTTMSATFEGLVGPSNFFNPLGVLEPDGEKHEWDFVFMFRLEDGKVAEEWRFWNADLVAAHTPFR